MHVISCHVMACHVVQEDFCHVMAWHGMQREVDGEEDVCVCEGREGEGE